PQTAFDQIADLQNDCGGRCLWPQSKASENLHVAFLCPLLPATSCSSMVDGTSRMSDFYSSQLEDTVLVFGYSLKKNSAIRPRGTGLSRPLSIRQPTAAALSGTVTPTPQTYPLSFVAPRCGLPKPAPSTGHSGRRTESVSARWRRSVRSPSRKPLEKQKNCRHSLQTEVTAVPRSAIASAKSFASTNWMRLW